VVAWSRTFVDARVLERSASLVSAELTMLEYAPLCA
jgi:hypothetical protein